MLARLAHLADIHLGFEGKAFGSHAEDLRQRLRDAFTRCLTDAIARDAHVLVVAGDLFDSNRIGRRTLQFAVAEIKRFLGQLPRAHVLLVPGTHDCLQPGCVYQEPAWEELGERCHRWLDEGPQALSLPDSGLSIRGLAHVRGQADVHPLQQLQPDPEARLNVAVVHGSLLRPGQVEHDAALVSEAELAISGFDYVALGHWHSALQLRAGATLAAYPGSPEVIALDATGDGGCLHVGFGPEGIQVTPTTTRTLTAQRLPLTAAEVGNTEGLRRRLEALADPNSVLDVVIQGIVAPDQPLESEAVFEELAGQFYRLRLTDNTELALEAVDLAQYPEQLVVGRFARLMLRRLEAAGDEEEKVVAREALQIGLSSLLRRKTRP